MEGASLLPEKPEGFCLVCSTQTSLVCHRCGDYYCSRECQLKDWQRHRYICFPIPPLVQPTRCSIIASINTENLCTKDNAYPPIIKPNELISPNREVATPFPIPIPTAAIVINNNLAECDKENNKAAASNITPKNEAHSNDDLTNTSPPDANIPNGSNVYITSFISSNRCIIRDASESAQKAYFSVLEKVNSLCQKLPRKSKIKYAEYALCKFNGRYHRVKSIDRKNPSRLLLLDEGIVKMLNLVDMREIGSELVQLPYCSMQVQLEDTPHFPYNQSFFRPFEFKQLTATFLSNGRVELKQKDSPKSLNEQISEFFGHGNTSDKKSNESKQVPEAIKNEGNGTNLQFESPQNIRKAVAIVHDANTNNSQPKVKEVNSTINPEAVKMDSRKEMQPQLNEIKSLPMSTADDTCTPKETENNNHTTPKPIDKLVKELNDNESPSSHSAQQYGADSANVTPMLCSPFEMQRLYNKSGDGLDAYIVESANASRGIIAAFDKLNLDEISEMRFLLSKFSDPRPYRPVLKEYVVALFEPNGWCRAKIMDIKENVYSVLFVDYAKGATVPENSIRRYPVGLAMPCYTSICLIDGFPHKPSQRQIDFLNQNLKLNTILHIDSVSYLQDMALIKCKTLIDQLNKL
ncbi:uncharacterized protein LOC132784723 [Drosophila nasuta]|uniref:uncharacterized protein LOC132784723 n=1 Tax=Drosophila nasuta TaxID=42062 RepID=UPI00295F404C|nr:uncharacterized protein LOC132784723 [Drosophila nasuta]